MNNVQIIPHNVTVHGCPTIIVLIRQIIPHNVQIIPHNVIVRGGPTIIVQIIPHKGIIMRNMYANYHDHVVF